MAVRRKPKTRRTPADPLLAAQEEILAYARSCGLDPIRTVFEPIDIDEMNEIAAYGGFPTRLPHWRFGMEYEHLRKSHTYGLSRIYELVINNDPCYAYLLRSNPMVVQKMVIAHVYGHSDFFKNNMWFSQTNRHMIDEMANHGTRVRRHIERHGEKAVEEFCETAFSLDNLIDHLSVYSPSRPREQYDFSSDDAEAPAVRKLKAEREYMDRFINPPEYLERRRQEVAVERDRRRRFPTEPTKDVLEFLIRYAPLEMWQRDILSIAREEAYYFAPQALTKIMNEGWATYWHTKIMTQKALADAEVIDYADQNAGVLGTSPGTLNPYKLGVELWRDIEDRWNRGAFGREYEECDDLSRRRHWDLQLGQGIAKVFEVRRIYNDVGFIDHFLTKEFCERSKLFVYRKNPQSAQLEISDRDFEAVKKTLLMRLTNMGQPIIRVVDGNYANRSELLLEHAYEGLELDLMEARDTLKNLHAVWKRPVNLRTTLEDEAKILRYDGEKHSQTDAEQA